MAVYKQITFKHMRFIPAVLSLAKVLRLTQWMFLVTVGLLVACSSRFVDSDSLLMTPESLNSVIDSENLLALNEAAFTSGGEMTKSRGSTVKMLSTHNNGEEQVSPSFLALLAPSFLRDLIEVALNNNLQRKVLLEQLSQAQLNTKIARSSLFPQVNTSVSATRGSQTVSNPGGQSDAGVAGSNTRFALNLDAAWEVDLWGRLQFGREAFKASEITAAQDLEYAKRSLVAQILQGWFEFQGALALFRNQRVKFEQLTLLNSLVEERYTEGVAAVVDLHAARRNLAQTRVQLLSEQEHVAAQQRNLRLLVGEFDHQHFAQLMKPLNEAPEQAIPDEVYFDDWISLHAAASPKSFMQVLPASLSVQLITNRPDLKSAWAKTLTAQATYQANRRARYPAMVLTASSGRQSQALKELVESPSIWSIASQLTAPLFDAEELKQRAALSLSQAQQAYLQYCQALLGALIEVDAAMSLNNSLVERERNSGVAQAAAEATYQSVKEAYQEGTSSILDLLNTQINLYDVKAQSIQLQTQRLSNRVSLALALGYGL